MLQYLNNIKLSKWQIAILVGTPILVGSTVYIYKKTVISQTKSNDGIAVEEPEKKPKEKKPETTNVELTPLQKANQFKVDGNRWFKSGKFDEAIECYTKAIDVCPKENKQDLAIFYQNRAASYEMLKKWKSVIEDTTKSLEFNPQYSKAYYRRCKAYEATNDYVECLNDITATCLLENFENSASVYFADRILRTIGQMEAEKTMKSRPLIPPHKTYLKYYFLTYQKDPCVNFKVEEMDDNTSVAYFKAKQALTKFEIDDIIPYCTKELENPDSEFKYHALLLRGTLRFLSGAQYEAKRDFTEIIDSPIPSPTIKAYAYVRRGLIQIHESNPKGCFEDLQSAYDLVPNNADVLYQRGQCYVVLNSPSEALEWFKKAEEVAPYLVLNKIQRIFAEYRVALTNVEVEKVTKIIDSLKAFVKETPNADAYQTLAQILSEHRDYEGADENFTRAIEMDPENAVLYVFKGIMMLQWKGDIDACTAMLNKALTVDPRSSIAYETLGTIEVQRSNLHRAVDLFGEAVKYSRTSDEMAHVISLRQAALAQIHVSSVVGLKDAVAGHKNLNRTPLL